MKIVLVSFLYEPEIGGGASVVVHQLAHALSKRSYTVTVITTWKGSYVKTELIDEIKVIRIPPLNLYWVGEKDGQSITKKIIWQLIDTWNPMIYHLVRRILMEENADIVHTHKLRGISPTIWNAANSAGIKNIIHTCHDYELLSPQGYFMGRVGKLALHQSILVRPYQSLRRSISKLVRVAIAPSRYVLDIHKQMGFFPNAISRVIQNSHGLSQAELKIKNSGGREELIQLQNDFKFLYLGRLDKAKGVDILCQAFIEATLINPKICLKIAGWGPMENFLNETYSKVNNIKFIGKVFGPQKDELLKHCEILIVPSISPEPFGIVIAEGYAYGLPVIASNIGAMPEIIKDGKTGLLTQPGSVSDLSAAISRMCNDPTLVKEMSKKCRIEAERFSSDEFINKYIDIYQLNP